MNQPSDSQLLRAYAENRSEAAFAELVGRHVNFVYSAALRMVCDPHLAEDVAQGVFVALAKNAASLVERSVLSGWLHRTAQNIAAQTVRTIERRRAREQEVVAMNELLAADSVPFWADIAPHLDAALGELPEADRDAILLRYFERKSAKEMAVQLGISDEAAQKRVNRAVERLREFFAKRGVTAGAGGLAVVISANAVQAAPVGLALTISTAVALTETTLATTATVAATKAIAMTTIQKTVVTATIAILAGAGIYEARQASQLREQVQALQQQQTPLAKQIADLNQALIDATNQLAALRNDNERLNQNTSELLKLRGEIGVLRRQLADGGNAKTRIEQPPLSSAIEYYRRAERHRSENEYEAQFEDLNNAIELDQNLANAYKDRASLYAQNLPKSYGGYAKAVADYTRYLELKPKDAPIRHNRGLYYERLGQFDNSIADYTMVIEGDLDFEQQLEGKNKLIALDYLYRGRIYHWQKEDYAKAISDYTAALALDPQREGAHRLRGQAYESIGELEKAQQDFAIEPKN